MTTKKKPTESVWDETDSTPATASARYDIEGLMTDFPTARELEKFVYDETGLALNLKGRSNTFKYQAALDALEGREVAHELLTGDNPYIDRSDMVPVDPVLDPPARAEGLPDRDQVQNFFHMRVPHPDAKIRNNNGKVSCCFRKYNNGVITYEIEGPITYREEGSKVDKFGRTRAEVVRVVDPRTGEQVVRDNYGNFTEHGKRLRAIAQKNRFWDQWIDREFSSVNHDAISNPWA